MTDGWLKASGCYSCAMCDCLPDQVPVFGHWQNLPLFDCHKKQSAFCGYPKWTVFVSCGSYLAISTGCCWVLHGVKIKLNVPYTFSNGVREVEVYRHSFLTLALHGGERSTWCRSFVRLYEAGWAQCRCVNWCVRSRCCDTMWQFYLTVNQPLPLSKM